MSEDSINDFLVLYASNDPDRPATATADLDIDADGRPVKTRFRRWLPRAWAQVIAARRSAGEATSLLGRCFAPLPRFAGVTSPRQR